jgi:hypothetical protein
MYFTHLGQAGLQSQLVFIGFLKEEFGERNFAQSTPDPKSVGQVIRFVAQSSKKQLIKSEEFEAE